MKDSLERWVGDDGLVEGSWLCNVLNNDKAKLVLGFWMGLCDLVCLGLAADRAYNGVSVDVVSSVVHQ